MVNPADETTGAGPGTGAEASRETSVADGVTLLGAEMLTWSDIQGPVGAFGGLLAPLLLHDFDRQRRNVLVAGPHDAAVVAEVAGQFDGADVLVRSWDDAEALHHELGDVARVLCGPLERLPRPEHGYDAVVALAGLPRVHSLEDPEPSWQETLDLLVALLSDTGELFVALGNDVGIDRLLSLAPEQRDNDAAWPEGRWEPDRVPGNLATVSDYLAREKGLTPVETWACHGRRSRPLLAAPTGIFEERRLDPFLQRLVAHAYDVHDEAAPLLKNPVSTGRDLVRWGLAGSTAPTWILHVQRRTSVREHAHRLFVEVPGSAEGPALALRFDLEADRWVRSLVGDAGTVRVAEAVTRDLGKLAGPVPTGQTVSDVLQASCTLQDLAASGELVRAYVRWLDPDDEGMVPAERVPATLGLLALPGGGPGEPLEVFDPSLRADAAYPFRTVLLRTLLVFAHQLLSTGSQHAWPPSVNARRVARNLAAAADLEVTEDQLDEAVALDRRLRPSSLPQPDFSAVGGGVQGRSYAELAQLAKELSDRAEQAEEHNLWLLRQLQIRQRRVRKAVQRAEDVERSPEYRYGRKVLLARRAARKVRDKLRGGPAEPPPGEWRPPKEQTELPPGARPRTTVEKHLLPPGYVPPEEVIVVPSAGEEGEQQALERAARRAAQAARDADGTGAGEPTASSGDTDG